MESKKRNKAGGWNLGNSYSILPGIFFTEIEPEEVSSPELIVLNDSLALELGLELEHLKSRDGISILSGKSLPEGASPIAQAYAGHQFGYFTMLGDGRAILIGEQITPSGTKFDIQLKGSGRTPYSRRGDGRASLGPMLREYIISEAMSGLGIPTTRSLAVCKTGDTVFRETAQKGAVLARVASSHIRVGTFQYASRWGSLEDLKHLADYTIDRHFSSISGSKNRYTMLLREVVKKQAYLIAKWQLVGFVHGVMNTDNMAINGETIDYGPCAFMDSYDIDTVFSSIDREGRYSYGNQPNIAAWNLTRFAEALLPLMDKEKDKAIEIVQREISDFTRIYRQNWNLGMRSKLGISNIEVEDESLVQELLDIMQKNGSDYTNTFRELTLGQLKDSSIFSTDEFVSWKKKWESRLKRQDFAKSSILELMKSSNPSVIPRNHRVEEALKAAESGDMSYMEKLVSVLKNPYEYSEIQEEYVNSAPKTDLLYRTYCGT